MPQAYSKFERLLCQYPQAQDAQRLFRERVVLIYVGGTDYVVGTMDERVVALRLSDLTALY